MSDFQPAIDNLLGDEGGAYNPEDHGRGPSKWGITLATLRCTKPDATADDIANMDRATAAAFYQDQFWNRYHIALINDQALATKVLDMAVNMGAGDREHDGAITLLQYCVGAPKDGILGSVTAGLVNQTNAELLMGEYRSALIQHYQDILNKHPDWENDRAGWMARALK